MTDAGFWDQALRLLNITLIDVALSGDNAIVIGMAAATLPRERRTLAIALGGALAIVLRIGLTVVATFLMLVPYLSAIGGLVLVWVVWRLLKPEPEAEAGDAPEGGAKQGPKEAKSFRQAILLIVAADFMMSLDNVIAVAGSAHGSVFLLIAGLLISMPLLMTAGGLISGLIDRARWLVYVGAAAISFTAARMVFEDKAVAARVHAGHGVTLLVSAAAALLIPALLVGGRRLARKQ
jgi:YjbE family integral membrane protein